MGRAAAGGAQLPARRPLRAADAAAGAWLQAAPLWLGQAPTDSSAKSLVDVVRRAVASLLGVRPRDVFAAVASPTLPFVKDERLAPRPFIDLLSGELPKLYAQFEHTDDAPQAEWPCAVAQQLMGRCGASALPATASFCWPKVDDAVLFFGLRHSPANVERSAAALAVVMSVAQRLPKRDLPTFEHARTAVLTDVGSDEPGDEWVCAILFERSFAAIELQTLVETVRKSKNLQVVDLCDAVNVTAAAVNELLAIPHVRVVAVVGVERVVEQCDRDLAHKLVWVAHEDLWQSGLTREQIDRHRAFFALQYQALTAWRHGPRVRR